MTTSFQTKIKSGIRDREVRTRQIDLLFTASFKKFISKSDESLQDYYADVVYELMDNNFECTVEVGKLIDILCYHFDMSLEDILV